MRPLETRIGECCLSHQSVTQQRMSEIQSLQRRRRFGERSDELRINRAVEVLACRAEAFRRNQQHADPATITLPFFF